MKRSVVCVLLLLLLPAALLATSTSSADANLVTIKVLQSQTVPLKVDASTVITGCNGADYSAACMHSADQFVQNMMVVQTEEGKKFTIACTIETKWSSCVPLPEGESFRARIGKNDLTVAYIGSKGKPSKHQYRVLPEGAFAAAAKAAAEAETK